MAAQREDTAAGPSDVAEQQLQDRRRADVLHADGVLRPADGVAEGGGALAPGVRRDRLGDAQEDVLRRPADLFDELWRIAREVALEDLEDAARMLERLVAWRLARVTPTRGIIDTLLG